MNIIISILGNIRIAEAIISYAIEQSEIIELREDINARVCVNGKDNNGRTVFHHCVCENNMELLTRITPLYKNETDGDSEGQTMLMLACEHSSIAIVQHILETMKVDRTVRDKQGRDALFHAVMSRRTAIVEYLLKDNVEFVNDKNGTNVLMLAAEARHLELIELLLSAKHNRTLVLRYDNHKRNVIHYCAMCKETVKTSQTANILELLHYYKADVDSANELDGATPVMFACKQSDVTLLKALLKKGAQPNSKDLKGFTPLHYCFQSSNPSLHCVRLLIDHGANINAMALHTNNNDSGTRNRNIEHNNKMFQPYSSVQCTGTTALMLASSNYAVTHIPIITCLLNAGADPFLQDEDGRDSLDMCPFEAQYVKAMMEQNGGNFIKQNLYLTLCMRVNVKINIIFCA